MENRKSIEEYPIISIIYPHIIISGSSISEDPEEFWYSKIKEFEQIAITWNRAIVDFKLDYYNTGTLFYLTAALKIFQEMSKNVDVKINWYYDVRDTDMMEMGDEFKKSMKINIRLIKR